MHCYVVFWVVLLQCECVSSLLIGSSHKAHPVSMICCFCGSITMSVTCFGHARPDGWISAWTSLSDAWHSSHACISVCKIDGGKEGTSVCAENKWESERSQPERQNLWNSSYCLNHFKLQTKWRNGFFASLVLYLERCVTNKIWKSFFYFWQHFSSAWIVYYNKKASENYTVKISCYIYSKIICQLWLPEINTCGITGYILQFITVYFIKWYIVNISTWTTSFLP